MSDKRTLYTIVGGGFSTNIKKAFVSFLYPITAEKDKSIVPVPSLIDIYLRESVFINEPDSSILNLHTIVSGQLSEPIIYIFVNEYGIAEIPPIVSGLLNDAKFYTVTTEIGELSIYPIVNGSLNNSLFYNTESEQVDVSISSIVGGSLI